MKILTIWIKWLHYMNTIHPPFPLDLFDATNGSLDDIFLTGALFQLFSVMAYLKIEKRHKTIIMHDSRISHKTVGTYRSELDRKVEHPSLLSLCIPLLSRRSRCPLVVTFVILSQIESLRLLQALT